MKLEGKCAIVTGGGGAIGRSIVRRLASHGAKIAVFDIDENSAGNAAREIPEGGKAMYLGVDVSNFDSVMKSVEKVVAEFGSADILVNSAGGSARGEMRVFHEQKIEVVNSMLGVNLFGALHLIRAVSPYMIRENGGRIINITSIVALGGMRACTEYAAAKGGILAATKCLAIELGQHNVTVNCVSPGKVERRKLEDEKAFAHRFSCVNRICTQDDIASMVEYLAMPEADCITGQNFVVDGGRSLGLKGDFLQ